MISISCATDEELIKMYNDYSFTQYYHSLVEAEMIRRGLKL